MLQVIQSSDIQRHIKQFRTAMERRYGCWMDHAFIQGEHALVDSQST